MQREPNPCISLHDRLLKPSEEQRAATDGLVETATGWKRTNGHAAICAGTGDPAACGCLEAESISPGASK